MEDEDLKKHIMSYASRPECMDPDKDGCMCVAVYHDFWEELSDTTMMDLYEQYGDTIEQCGDWKELKDDIKENLYGEYKSTIYKNGLDRDELHRDFWCFVGQKMVDLCKEP